MKKFRVAEIFGPTIQGEGRHVGVPCHFIRFGGCDYRCVWCDSPHAVLPELVAQLPMKTEEEIWDEVRALPTKARWIVYSGGNPALLDLSLLTDYLLGDGYSVMMETQGTIWKDWMNSVDEVCVSPKPPSSENETDADTLEAFLSNSTRNNTYLKVVVFDEADYEYAQFIHSVFPSREMFISAGTMSPDLPTVAHPERVASTNPDLVRELVLGKMTWLMEILANDVLMRDVRVLPQMHVLAWGNVRGR